MNEVYIGDGLYASIEGGVVKLRAPRDGGDHEVYLEPEVLQSFLDFLMTNNIINVPPEVR